MPTVTATEKNKALLLLLLLASFADDVDDEGEEDTQQRLQVRDAMRARMRASS